MSYLTPGGIEANRIWFEDFVRELQERDAPMDAIFAYQLRNEAYYDLIWPPFSLTEGMITAANGETYDMADPDDRQRMMDEGWLNWIDEMVDGIKALDPTALVTMGFFYPMGPESDRLVYTEPVLHRSSLDFVDLHAYPDVDVTSLDEYVERFKLEAIEEKPILMGEFGVGKEPVPSIADAARMLQWWQVNSCDYGFDGWLLWSWGTGDASAEFWAAVSAEREVNQALAPVFRPDACQPGPEMLEHPNLAYQKPVTASNEETTAYNGQKAVDGSLLSWWSAADGPPQTLEIDLEAPMAVGGFRLPFGDLTPLGFQRHEVWVKGPEAGASYELVHVFEADVTVGDVLEHRFPEPLEGIQFVRLRTVQMNDWVILHEFEILAPE